MKKIILVMLVVTMSIMGQDAIKVVVNESASELDLKIVDHLRKEFRSVEVSRKSFSDCMSLVKEGKADIAIGNITINGDREQDVDFSVPYRDSSLRILRRDKGSTFGTIGVFFVKMMPAAITFLIFLAVCGVGFWWAERGSNEGISDDFKKGFWQGVWLTMTTASTVGYGKICPVKPAGRVLACIVMFSGIVLFGYVVGITTSIWNETNVAEIQLDELSRYRIGTVKGSASEDYLAGNSAKPVVYDNIDKVVLALYKDEVDCVLYDGCILEVFMRKDLILSEKSYKAQQYGIVVGNGSELRDKINKMLHSAVN